MKVSQGDVVALALAGYPEALIEQALDVSDRTGVPVRVLIHLAQSMALDDLKGEARQGEPKVQQQKKRTNNKQGGRRKWQLRGM